MRASQQARGADAGLVDAVLAADERRRAALAEFERVRAEQKSLGKQVAAASGEQRQELLRRARELADRVKALQGEVDAAGEEFDRTARRIDNVVEAGTPSGGEQDYVVLREVGSPRDFAAEGFEPLDHLALGERLRRHRHRARREGLRARFYFLTGVGARLQLALLNCAMDRRSPRASRR